VKSCLFLLIPCLPAGKTALSIYRVLAPEKETFKFFFQLRSEPFPQDRITEKRKLDPFSLMIETYARDPLPL